MKEKNINILIILILIIVGAFYFYKNDNSVLIGKLQAKENLDKSFEAYYFNKNKDGLLVKYQEFFFKEDGSLNNEKKEEFEIYFYYINQNNVFKKEQIIGSKNSLVFTTLNGITKYGDKIYYSFTPGIIKSCEILNNFICTENIFDLESGVISTTNGFYPNNDDILLMAFQGDMVQIYKLDKTNNTSKIFDSKLDGFSFNQTQAIIRDYNNEENIITLLSIKFDDGVNYIYYKIDLSNGEVLSIDKFNNEKDYYGLLNFDSEFDHRKKKNYFINNSANPENKEYLKNYFDGGYISLEVQNFWEIFDN